MRNAWLRLALLGFASSGWACAGDDDASGTGGGASCDGAGAAGVPAPVQWAPCNPVPATAPMAECASLDVPIDYEDPSAGSYALELMRVAAGNLAEKSGVVLLNVGGPGGIATDVMAQNGVVFQATEVGQRKDLIAMDIRGVSADTRPGWMTTALVESLRSVDRTPDDDSDWQALDTLYANLTQAALADTPVEKLATLGTRDTVRDMARLLAALGEERLDYIGLSYGTLTGAAFASACPSLTGHFVLDAPVPPVADAAHIWVAEALSLDKHLSRLADLCSKNAVCPLYGKSSAEILALRQQLAAELETSGGIQLGTRKIVESDLHFATRGALWSGVATELWAALAAADQGAWDPLLALADAFWDRRADGSYGYPGRKWGILLNDSPCPAGFTLADAKEAIAEANQTAPELGGFVMTETMVCLHWPVLGPALAIAKTSAPPALMIGGNLDALTPVEGMTALSDALGNGSYLLTHEQPGHVVFGTNSCVNAAMIQFILDGEEPSVTHCDAN